MFPSLPVNHFAMLSPSQTQLYWRRWAAVVAINNWSMRAPPTVITPPPATWMRFWRAVDAAGVWLRDTPTRSPALWQQLEKVTDHGTDSAKLAAFEKHCFNKLDQIAGEAQSAA